MGKKNRDKLMQQSMYDMLLKMNENLMAFNATCIMIGLIGYDKKFIRCFAYKYKCNQCLQSWMNEDPI